jgi:hypothetical protein
MTEPGAGGGPTGPFAFVQLEFGFPLGPREGRYLVRRSEEAAPERVLVVATGEGERVARGRLGRRGRGRGRAVDAAAPARVPTTLVTLVEAKAFADETTAESWLARLRLDDDELARRVEEGMRALNRVLRAHRAAVGDPYVGEVSQSWALARRVGFGDGASLAEGRFAEAVELPATAPRRTRRPEREGPQQRLAAVLAGREQILVCEELVLRARGDVDAGRPREAALEARVALEAMLAELAGGAAVEDALAAVRERREAVVRAAAAALDGDPPEGGRHAVGEAVERMEEVLRRRHGC